MRRLLLGVFVTLASCAPPKTTTPDFNAVDPSLTCEAGKIGWDFSTGGNTDDVRVMQQSNELRIIEATVGQSCGASPGNRTESFANSCNGLIECSRAAILPTENNPTEGCLTPTARVRYQCGAEDTIYESEFPAWGFPEEVRLMCGLKLTVVSATIGKNCDELSGRSDNTGNATAGLVNACNGARVCDLPYGLMKVATGRLQGNGCGYAGVEGNAEVQFTCGSDPTIHTQRASTPYEAMRIFCPPRPPRDAIAIRVMEARLAGRDLTAKFRSVCDGRTTCSRPLLLPGETDPSPGEPKYVDIRYDCGAGGPQDPLWFTTTTPSQVVTLRCGQPITVKSVSLAKACNATESAKLDLARLFSRCTGRGSCVMNQRLDPLGWMSACTPAQTGWEVVYTCGSSPDERKATAAISGPVELTCPAVAPANPSSGIRVVDATLGLNCPGAPIEKFRNNLYSSAYACTGQSSCTMSTILPPNAREVCRSPDVQVNYRCGEDEEVHSVTAPAGTTSVRLSCEPNITVASATWGEGCSGTTGNATAALARQCNGKLGQCAYSVSALGLATPSSACSKSFSVSWRCGADPARQTATLSADATNKTGTLTCATPTTPYVRKACVPQQCVGKARRDENLACVSDLTKLVIPAPSRWSLLSSQTRGALEQNSTLSLTMSAYFDAVLPVNVPFNTELAQATVYAVDRFVPRGGGTPIEGFRCVVANPGIRRPALTSTIGQVEAAAIAAGKVLVAQASNFVVPEGCFGANVPSWRDALRRYQSQTGQTVSEADFRSGYRLEVTELRVAFDAQGRTAALRTAGTTETTAMVPNPIGFFYTPSLGWVDFKSFYEQARMPAPPRTQQPNEDDLAVRNLTLFRPSSRMIIAASKATLRKAEVEVDLYDATRLPTLEIDFDWSMKGDSPGRNPYSPTTQLTPDVKNVSQLNLGATVEIQAREIVDAQGWGAWGDGMVVGKVQGTLLGTGQPTGTTTRLLATFTEALRSRLVTVKTDSNNGWMATNNEPMREFRVRVCLDMDTVFRYPTYDFSGLGVAVARGDEVFSAMLGAGPAEPSAPRCVVANQVLIVKRTLEEKALPHDHDSADTQVGNSVDQGNSDVNNATDMGNVGTCLRRCSVAADCASDQTCQSGVCQGGSTTRCTSETGDSSGGSGVFGASMLRTSSKTTIDDGTSAGGNSTSSANAELLGFQILQKSEQQKWTTPGAHAEFTLSPNWDVIIAIAREGLRNGTQASLVQPFVSGHSWEKGRQGLGIGIGRSFYIFIGPVPIMAEVSVSVAFGISLAFGFDLRSDYPCIGTQACYRQYTDRKTLAEANEVCQDAGGQLVELTSANALAGARAAITDSSLEYWVGGQQAILWPQPSCATNRNDTSCINQSSTRYRWVKSNVAFAEQRARNTTLVNTANYTSAFGGTTSQLNGLVPRVPNLGGVVLKKGASASADALLARSLTETKPFVCEFAPASSARSSAWSAGIVLNASAGASFSLCVPHSSLGICLSAGLNFIDAELAFTFERSNTRLWDRQGLLLSQEGNDTFQITAGLAFLTGAISVEIKLLFFSIGYDLVKFDGVKRFEWTLYKHQFPTSQQ